MRLKNSEALIILENLLKLYQQSSSKTQYLRVITGIGKHSPGGEPVLKPAVIEYLLKHNFEVHNSK
jgi:DNA-nicking Smr family endonuclease